MVYIVDRFENGYAVLEDEQMNTVNVPRPMLDKNAKEGSSVIYNGKIYVTNNEMLMREKIDSERIRSKFDKLKGK